MSIHEDRVRQKVEDTLHELADLFVKDARLTLIMRVPGDDECEMLVTSDDAEELIEMLYRTLKRKKTKLLYTS